MKYNKVETLKHVIAISYANCVKDYNQIVLDEDDSINLLPTIFDNVQVIDLDCVEKKLAGNERRNQKSTMDTTFAISDSLRLEMLLVELRFNYINLANLNRKKLLDKVAGSTSILGSSIKINNDYIFIFKSNLIEQAKNRLLRMNPVIPSNYIVMDLQTLFDTYFK
ncbi:hypothetical protein [Chryseobacterium sp. EO14]|uniref:hypothetical protein n=1 Tax=Chryseobacterium sp. EO14 TaxID=2950551 RepID=UPI00210A0441|nr:hypothetical protein [Chryseobacterium sp. EO14]MCQ4142241.1 hypothetical protein [Chryseobacterium sp. EO14]